VTDRGPLDAPLACPFLAFEDDRDGRSLRPDHRHRCFAEIRPAPRAIAHQERYCLTAAFATCPTFLDWARREAAVVREPAGGAVPGREGEAVGGAMEAGSVAAAPTAGSVAAAPAAEELPRRDWAAPPPWAGQEGGPPAAPIPPFLAPRQGPAPDATEVPPVGAPAPTSLQPSAGAEARVDARAVAEDERGPVIDPARRGVDWRPRDVPPWERPRRFEAYPRLRTRMGLPTIPPLLLAAAAVVVAALALFFIPPMLLDLGGGAAASPSPSPSLASPSVVPSPTATPAPTPLVYVVQPGDTLSKIAKKFGVGLDVLIEANKETIPNPDRIDVGDRVIIPTPPPDVIPGESSASPPEAPGALP
jgi:LysM repeat protein